MRSLRIKLLVWLVGVITVLLAGLGAFTYHQRQGELLDNLAHQRQAVMKRAGLTLPEALYGFDERQVEDLAAEGASREERQDIDPHSGMMRQSIVLRDAVYRANKIIFQTAQSQTHCEGMGTTIVACMFYDNKVSIAHVGDSRAYRLRGDQFEQLTLDHSLLQELVDRGFYSHDEAQRSTNRNYVTRALGVEPTVEVEVNILTTGLRFLSI